MDCHHWLVWQAQFGTQSGAVAGVRTKFFGVDPVRDHVGGAGPVAMPEMEIETGLRIGNDNIRPGLRAFALMRISRP